MREHETMWDPPDSEQVTKSTKRTVDGAPKSLAQCSSGGSQSHQNRDQGKRVLTQLKNGTNLCEYYQTDSFKRDESCQFAHTCGNAVGRQATELAGFVTQRRSAVSSDPMTTRQLATFLSMSAPLHCIVRLAFGCVTLSLLGAEWWCRRQKL